MTLRVHSTGLERQIKFATINHEDEQNRLPDGPIWLDQDSSKSLT